MALVTVQRSPSVSSSPQSSDSGAGGPTDDDEASRTCAKSLSECYFAGKGAALVLPPNERARPSRRVSAAGCDIQQHLQSMFYLLRPEETLKMAVKLESVHPGRTRYLVVVSCQGRQDAEESCLLGIDCNERATVGLVLRVLADTAITLDGDGGFSVSVCGCQHIFKPVSVQAMWSALQTLHKVSSKAREQNYFLGGLSHDWVSYYEQRIESDRSCLNEWHAMDNLESRRPPSPDSVRSKPRERDETERVIRATLKEIMMSVDLDEVTSKYIRGRLEEDLNMDLGEFKSFIDQEMLTILGQMDAPTEIFDHVYLGSEWNASNLEELQKNGVRHILNVTREIDNFFPGMFNYLNVRVYDDEKTDLLKHWDDTFKYISKAKKEGSKVLVHCKMGVSRSASVVIAYAMKAYNWDFSQALRHVKNKRNCIKPNNSFLLQLETYQGILDAMKNKEKLQRSKSDTNLKSPTATAQAKERAKKEEKAEDRVEGEVEGEVEGDEDDDGLAVEQSGTELKKTGQRPKSWSPNVEITEDVLPTAPLSQSLESIDKSANPEVTREDLLRSSANNNINLNNINNMNINNNNSSNNPKSGCPIEQSRNVLMPCDNGQSYSVSQNQIVHLPGPDACKHARAQFESQGQKRKGLVLNLTNQFEAASSKPSSPSSEGDRLGQQQQQQQSQQPQQMQGVSPVVENGCCDESAGELGDKQQQGNSGNNGECLVWTASTEVKCIHTNGSGSRGSLDMSTESSVDASSQPAGGRKAKKDSDPFSAQLDRVFDREERREPQAQVRESPSRQSSWSSYDSAVVMDNNSVHSSWATLPSRNSSWGSYDMRPAADSLGSSGLFPYDKEEIPWHPGTVKRTKQKLEESSTSGTSKRVCTQSSDSTSDDKLADRLGVPDHEVENPTVLLHYTSSPTPRRRDPSPIADHQPPLAASDSHAAAAPIDISPAASSRATTTSSRLSTSAPAPSSLASNAELTPQALRSCKSESETSSPCVVNTPQCPSVKHHKMVLENLCNKPIFAKRAGSMQQSATAQLQDDSPESECPLRSTSGIVKNLKKEFEAKSSSKLERSPDGGGSLDASQEAGASQQRQKRDGKIRSLPSSPVIPHNDSKIQTSPIMGETTRESRASTFAKRCSEPPPSTTTSLASPEQATGSLEDLSVKVLVGKYEVAKPEPVKRVPEVQLRVTSAAQQQQQQQQHNHHHHHFHHHYHQRGNRDGEHAVEHPPAKSKIAPDLARRSAPMIINHHTASLFDTSLPTATTAMTTTTTTMATAEAPGRPPSVPSPSQVVASVVAKAASKKQQQHGRTHPLARLQVRPRHSSPVYNTM